MFLILLPQFNFCSSKQEITTDLEDITVTYPNGGEELAKGSTVVIKWNSTISNNNNTKNSNNSNNNNSVNNKNNDSNVTYSSTIIENTNKNDSINQINAETKGDTIPEKVKLKLAKEIEKINRTINLSSIDCSFMKSSVFPVIGLIVASAAIVGGVIALIVIGVRNSNSNDYSNNVNIDLYKNDNFLFTIGHRRKNTGSLEWSIPDKLSGRDYKIKITSSVNSEIFDFSDETFSIIDENLINDKNNSNNTNENLTNDDDNNDNDTNSNTNNNNTNTDSPNSNNNSENNNIETDTTENSNLPYEFVLNGYNDSAILTESIKYNVIPDDENSNINFNQLPTHLKHYIYLNLQSVTDKLEELPESKSRKLDEAKNKYIKEYYRNSPKDRELIRMLLGGSFEDNLQLYDEVDEIVMGFDSIDKKTKRPTSPAILIKVSSIYGIASRLEESVIHKKSVIAGYNVYTSDEKSTIIISDYIIGATSLGYEGELIESYNNPHNRTDIITYSKDSDLFCADFDVNSLEGITEYLELDAFNININDFDSVNLIVTELNDAFSVNINGITNDLPTAQNYQHSLNNTLSAYRSTLQKFQANNKNTDIVNDISNILDTLTIEVADSSLCIEFQINLQ